MIATLFLSITSTAALVVALIPTGSVSHQAYRASLAQPVQTQGQQYDCPPGMVPLGVPPYCG